MTWESVAVVAIVAFSTLAAVYFVLHADKGRRR